MTTTINRVSPNGWAADLLASAADKMNAAIADAREAAALLKASDDPQIVTLGEMLTAGLKSLPVSAKCLRIVGKRIAEHRS